MPRNGDATLEYVRAQLGLLRRMLWDVYTHELDHDVGGFGRRAGLDGAQKLLLAASDGLRAVVRDYPVALTVGKQWEPGDPMPCSRCEKRSANYLVTPDGFILCLRCVPRGRLVVR